MADKHSESYQEALRRIEKNYRSKESSLNLTDLELTELPPEIGKLKHLRNLDIGLGYKRNRLHNYLKSLPKEIGQLTNLQLLSLDNNQLIELPKEIGQLTKLKALHLHNNQLSKLPKEIAQLTKLIEFFLSGNQLRELPKEVGQLTNLRTLYLNDNQLRELPKEITQLTNLDALVLHNNQLNIPPEIFERWREAQVILNYYLENVVGIDRPLNEIKMLLLGEGEVGKTALVHRLIFDEFKTTGKTEGIDIHKWNVEIKKNCQIQINIWDFAGQEITHATHQFFLTKRSLYLLVLASRLDEKANRLEEWLKVIQNLGGESPVIIICNKSDEHQMNLDERALMVKYPNIREIIKVSCKKGTNIKTLRKKILAEIKEIPHVFEPFSQKWFSVKQRLENLRENYIPFEDYLKICKREGVTKDLDRETLITFLHDLGVVLNFLDDPLVNETSVLKPEWITGGVYKILTSKLLADKHGVLTLEMVRDILDNRRYPKTKHRFIVQMMEKFERCFPLDKNKFLVPDLLPKQEPDFKGWEPQENGIGFQYHYEIEPSSFITRFIVNMNEYIDGETYWRKGVVLKNGKENRALVKADLEDKKIFIWIDGKMETRRGFLSIIRRQFEKIHQTMSNLKVTEYAQHPKGLIPYESLLRLEEKGETQYYFPDIDADVNVTEMLNGLEAPNERMNRAIRKKSSRLGGELANQYEMALMNKRYDVALSFAGEDRWYVSKVAQELKANNIEVFYDEYEQVNLWGKNLFDELDDIYRNRSEYVVMFISEHYAKKMWTDHERQSAFDNAIQAKKEYVLPARFDNTELKGLRKTVGYISLENMTPKDFAQMIVKKLAH